MTRWLSSTWLDLVISALVAAVQAAVVAPWLHLVAGFVGQPGAPVPSPVGIAVVGLATFWMVRACLAARWDVTAARAISLLLWAAMVIIWYSLAGAGIGAPVSLVEGLFAVRWTAWTVVVVAGLAWWRGLVLGSEPEPFTSDFVRRLILGGVTALGIALVLGALVGGMAGRAALDAGAVALPVVLIGGLVAAAGVQVRLSRRQVWTAGNRTGLGWLGAALGIALGIVLVALLIAGVAGRDVWAQVAGPLDALAGLVGSGVYWLFLALAYVVFFLLTPVFWLVHRLTGANQPQQPQQPGGPPKFPQFQQQAHNFLSPGATHALEVLLFVVLALVVLWLVLRSLRRFWDAAGERPVDEVRESVWSSDLAMEQLRGWLRGLGRRRPTRQRTHVDLGAVPTSVRDAYRHLLVLADRNDHAREPAESPGDYAARLGIDWSSVEGELDDLTARYLAARYGETESSDDARLAREDWDAINAYLRQARRSR